MENLTISTVPVTIRVMEVAGKRLTLSVFRQIPTTIFTKESNFIGWVLDYKGPKVADEYYILFEEDGVLFKALRYWADVRDDQSGVFSKKNQVYIAI